MAEVFGLELDGEPVQDGELVHSVLVVVEVLGEDGKMRLGLHVSEPMTAWQQYGLLRSAALAVEVDLRDAWDGG